MRNKSPKRSHKSGNYNLKRVGGGFKREEFERSPERYPNPTLATPMEQADVASYLHQSANAERAIEASRLACASRHDFTL